MSVARILESKTHLVPGKWHCHRTPLPFSLCAAIMMDLERQTLSFNTRAHSRDTSWDCSLTSYDDTVSFIRAKGLAGTYQGFISWHDDQASWKSPRCSSKFQKTIRILNLETWRSSLGAWPNMSAPRALQVMRSFERKACCRGSCIFKGGLAMDADLPSPWPSQI